MRSHRVEPMEWQRTHPHEEEHAVFMIPETWVNIFRCGFLVHDQEVAAAHPTTATCEPGQGLKDKNLLAKLALHLGLSFRSPHAPASWDTRGHLSCFPGPTTPPCGECQLLLPEVRVGCFLPAATERLMSHWSAAEQPSHKLLPMRQHFWAPYGRDLQSLGTAPWHISVGKTGSHHWNNLVFGKRQSPLVLSWERMLGAEKGPSCFGLNCFSAASKTLEDNASFRPHIPRRLGWGGRDGGHCRPGSDLHVGRDGVCVKAWPCVPHFSQADA